MRKKKAFITGITGQDGSYLTELLLDKGYEVHGLVRRTSKFNIDRIKHLFSEPTKAETELERGHQVSKEIEIETKIPKSNGEISVNQNLKLYYGDLTDDSVITKLIHSIQPDELYNLGAQSHVRASFDMPIYTADTDAMGTLRILEAIKNYSPKTRFYQASSSEMFGKVKEVPQTEKTPFHPRSPYGVAKVFSYWMTVNYRESYGLHTNNGILFNHESPRRGGTFVTKKITKALAQIKLGIKDELELGNLESKRDWGHAKDYVNAMWLMLQQGEPSDYVVSTGEMHTVREFVTVAASQLKIEVEWKGEGIDEVGIDKATGKTIVKVNPDFFRPAEVDELLGDPSYAEKKLGWERKYSFEELILDMVYEDLKKIKID